MYDFIAIEGNIGAGKTTLATMLAQDKRAELILEQFEDNPFLPDFYQNQEKNAFPLEMFFMAERYQQWQDIVQKNVFNQRLVSDYIFTKSLLFASITLKERELSLYKRFFHIINSHLLKPDVILYLHNPVEKLLANIQHRGREYEQSIPADYLLQIEEAYFEYFRQIKTQQRIIILKNERINFVDREIDFLRIKKILSEDYPVGMTVV